MKNKNLLYIVGAVVIVGGIIMYRRYQKNKKMAMNGSSLEEEKSEFAGNQLGNVACSSSNNEQCKNACERMGGTFNYDMGTGQGDRKCYKNGVAISGGMFGGRGLAIGKSIR